MCKSFSEPNLASLSVYLPLDGFFSPQIFFLPDEVPFIDKELSVLSLTLIQMHFINADLARTSVSARLTTRAHLLGIRRRE